MKSSNKYKSILTIIVSSLLLTNCGETYKEELVDHVNPQGSIYVLRNNFKGQDVTISESTLEGAQKIGGIVISNHENNNLPTNTIAIQNTWRGQTRAILVEVEDNSKYSFGDSLNMDLMGSTLTGKLGSLMITNVSESKISKISSGHFKTPIPVAISTLEKNLEQFESMLISLTADLNSNFQEGIKLAGSHTLIDGEKNLIKLTVNENATFSNNTLPAPSATFNGILFNNKKDLEIRMQKKEDLTYPSGKLLPEWPEKFEEPDTIKAGYAKWPVILPTGNWTFDQSMLGNTVGRDRIVSGKLAVRFNQNLKTSALLQMNFDVPKAGKVTLWYGAYYTDRSSTFQLEYSVDQGKTWKIVGQPIKDAHPTSESLVAKQAIFTMNINQPVRFRINKLGLGTSSNTINNGRLGIDDIAIYQSY